MHKSREVPDCQEGEGGEDQKGERAPLSCTPPLLSQKVLTHKGGGADVG